MPQDKDTVYLIDGSSYLHRAYHAIRGLANSKGFPTNAVFGFTKMLLKLIEERQPRYMAVVFDAPGPNFRHRLYEHYKANRPPMPDDMAQQIPVTKEIVENLDLKILEKEGYEADDVIGTLARRCEEKGHPVIIVTGDKDFRQVVSPRVSLLDTMKDKLTDYRSLTESYDLEPPQFVDVMGLCGDSSDNIPGVRGVGEKTALNLIRQFGSLEEVLAQVTDVKGKKLKERIEMSRADALLSKQLVQIDRSVPMEEDIEDLRAGVPRSEALAEIFRDLEFKELWDQFSDRTEEETDYGLVLKEEDLRALVAEIKKQGRVAVDTETTSQNPREAELVGISLAWEPLRAYYLPVAHRYLGAPQQIPWARAAEILREVFSSEKVSKVGQNIKYDAEVLLRHGLELKGIHFDTMIASYVINPGLRQHGLDYLAQHYLSHRMISYQDVVGKGKNRVRFDQVEVERAMAYSCEDADVTLRLMELLDQELRSAQNRELFYDMEMRLVPVLMDMEMTGIKIDVDLLVAMSEEFTKQMAAVEQEIYQEAGGPFNINSTQQLGFVLFEKLQLPGQRKTAKSKQYSTDVKVLERLSAYPHQLPRLVLRYRTLSKLKYTYLDAIIKMVDPATGRLHTSYNQTAAATGRLSSSSPNLQNIPIRGEEGREIRKAFVADTNHVLISADYSQVELRILAHCSMDPAFIEAFQRDEDIHARTASELRSIPIEGVTPDMRRLAKAINFGIIYGMGPRKLSEEQGLDLKTAKAYIARYYERYEGVAAYREEIMEGARRTGYVTTLFHRRRYLPNINHPDQRLRAEAERMAINTPIQGTAADLIKKAMITIGERLRGEKLATRMLLQIHDELVFEAPRAEADEAARLIREEMEGVYLLEVPLKVDMSVGDNWGEAHE